MSAAGVSPNKSYKELLVKRHDALLTIQFNRPQVRNAIRRRTVYELLRILGEANADAGINIIVLMGNTTAFSSGNDLADVAAMQNAGGAPLHAYQRSANYVLTALVNRVLNNRKILVALVQGVCVGFGVTLCALCDVVYATETAEFWTPFSQLGLCAEAGSSWTLPQILGRSKANEMLLFGARMDAQSALQHNFVAAVLRNEQLDKDFWPRMSEYSRLPAVSLQTTKRLLQQQWSPQLLAALRQECNELDRLRRGSNYLTQLGAFARRSKLSKL